ncbi:hypothetical protein C5167_007225 [Papaver somniferum]|nr:hypothetical protein C5167_007225 [Papaver somniferum]
MYILYRKLVITGPVTSIKLHQDVVGDGHGLMRTMRLGFLSDDDGNSQSNEGGRKVKYKLIAYLAIRT